MISSEEKFLRILVIYFEDFDSNVNLLIIMTSEYKSTVERFELYGPWNKNSTKVQL